jgi:hypothetical protein
MKLVGILSQIQRELKVPKERKNTFGNYFYRNAEDIVDAVKKALPENVALILVDELILIGSRYYVKATAKLISGEEFIKTEAFAREEEVKKGMDSSQITGAASSYARKYALCGLFAIDDGVDSDSLPHQNTQAPVQIDKSKAARDFTAALIKQINAIGEDFMEPLAKLQNDNLDKINRLRAAYPELVKQIDTAIATKAGLIDKKQELQNVN